MRSKKYDASYFTDKIISEKYNRGASSKKAKVLSSYDKLKNRINRDFPKRKLVGDIPINDEEFSILIEYLQEFYQHLSLHDWRICSDPLICVAMVQIGIRFYDGNFWKHFRQLLNNPSWNENRQAVMGRVCIKTLKEYEKSILNERDRINTILLHGFVSNHYAPKLMDFLYAYYRIDLERDLSRNDRFMMRELVRTIKNKDNSNRTYQLVRQTSDAVTCNPRGGHARIRWLLRLIDAMFWGEEVKINPANRYGRLFSEWAENSTEMRQRRNEIGPRQKVFSSPHISFSQEYNRFNILLPSQMVRTDYGVYWQCEIGHSKKNIFPDVEESVLAYKTEKIKTAISASDIFSQMVFSLLVGKMSRRFVIPEETIRFFTKEGVSVAAPNLKSGEYYAFSKEPNAISSTALIETRKVNQLWFYYLNFEDGDIVKTKEGKVVSIGKKVEEGLLNRERVKDAIEATEELPIYSSAPAILIKIQKSRLAGTAIIINGKKKKLEEIAKLTEVQLDDGSNNTGYWLDSSDIDCRKNGKYELIIDVPNDKTIRSWKYVLINGLNFSFDSRAPYFFEARGTIQISVRGSYKIQATDKAVCADTEAGFFNFPISSEFRQLGFCINKTLFQVCVPQFEYSFDNISWLTKKHTEIWHKSLPRKIWIRVPSNRLSLEVDNGEINDVSHAVTFEKRVSDDVFECDITRFRSWLNHDRLRNTILLNAFGKTIPFLDVIARSYVLSALPKADFESRRIIIQFDIVGQSDYYVDFWYENELIGEKIPIQDMQAIICGPIRSGKYTVEVFESNAEDDFDFDDCYFTSIYKKKTEIINPRDISGRSVEILSIMRSEQDNFKILFDHKYFVRNLRSFEKEIYCYEGQFLDERWPNARIPVKLELLEIEKLRFAHITWIDEEYGDEMELLYDSYDKSLVREERPGLRPSEKYRRYECIFQEDYFFEISVLT